MKIIKVTLQNINSIKSKTPIEIDFEQELFKDVGLFAITGATGAGKTTLLDAITIALYHQVPRFNHATHKKLEHVVSYGAHHAFSSVVFNNNNCTYEASWGISLATSNGKKRATPKEEVRLKDITNERILAEKKGEVKIGVEQITSLSYHQFLRSVLLAQGEFAAFLSAKGPDKAKLLEQITGEDIYKRIGETIQQRKAFEKKQLEDLEKTIDVTNILSDEALKIKKEEYEQIAFKTKALLHEETLLKECKTWYAEVRKLTVEKETLDKNKQELAVLKQQHQAELFLLQQDELAEPFKESLILNTKYAAELAGLEKKEIEVANSLSKRIKVKIAKEDLYDKKNENLVNAENKYKVWAPKLEQVAVLEATLKNENIGLLKLDKEYKALIQKNNVLQNEIKQKEEQQSILKKEEVPMVAFLEKNHQIPTIEGEYAAWQNSFTSLKEQQIVFKSLEKDKRKVLQNLAALTPQKKNLIVKLSSLEQEYQAVQKYSVLVTDFFKEHDLESYLKKKDNVTVYHQQLITLKRLSEAYQKNTKAVQQTENELSVLVKSIKSLQEKIGLVQISEKNETERLNYLEVIWQQEQVILSYEAERKKLEKGKACFVCGSLEHPYVQKYEKNSISDLEQKRTNKKKTLEKIISELEKLNITFISKTSEQQQLEKNKIQIQTTLQEIVLEYKTLDVGIELGRLETIVKEINITEEQLRETASVIREIQTKQQEKQVLETQQASILQSIHLFKKDISNFDTEEKNHQLRNQEIDEKLRELQGKIQEIQNHLLSSLKRFKIQTTKDEIKVVLNALKNNIQEHKTTTLKLQELQQQQNHLKVQISHDKNRLKEGSELLLTKQKEFHILNKSIQQNTTLRNTILPEKNTLESAKKRLDSMLVLAKKEVEVAKKELEIEQEQCTQLATQEKEIKQQVVHTSLALKNIDAKVHALLKNHSFLDVTEVKKSILKASDKERIILLKKELDAKESSLKALCSQNKNQLETIINHKNTNLTEEEVHAKLHTITNEVQQLLSNKGALEKDFEYNERFVKNNQKIVVKIKAQEKEFLKWSTLLNVLGGSKDAFNLYVQRLTLKSLIDLANIHLYKLNKRYSLKLETRFSKGEELNFKLLDHYQAAQVRSVDTCSGGEKFLISLALALGLSDLASNHVKIDSLFIDEGFGTLDANTLETVMSTLENLQSSGKTIGIISHVEGLKERIPVQIQLHKKGQGVSEVKLVG